MWASKRRSRKKIRNPRKKALFVGAVALYIVSFSSVAIYAYAILKGEDLITPLPQSVLSAFYTTSKRGDLETILKNQLKEKDIKVVDIKKTNDGDFFLLLEEGEEIIISKKKDITMQVASLQVVYSRLTMEGKRFSRLDFRFDKPLITPK